MVTDWYCFPSLQIGTALAERRDVVSAGDPAVAPAKLGKVLIKSAEGADCKHATGGSPSRRMRRDKPYVDQECRHMLAQVNHAVRHDPQHVKMLARRLSTTIRRNWRP